VSRGFSIEDILANDAVFELDDLKGPKRQEIIEKISAARDEGDLKENSGYHAAKEEQGKMEGRIMHLNALIENHVIVDPTDSNEVRVGSVVEIRYEIEKHLSEMQHSDSGKVEAAGFSAELANINYSFSRITTLAAMGAIPAVMVEALFNSVSKRDLETIADLCSFKDQTGGKNGITIMAPFTLESSKAAIESVLDQVEIAHLPMLSSKDSDPFKAVEEMISSPFGKLCARVNTTPAQVIAKARSRAADPTKSVTTLRKVS